MNEPFVGAYWSSRRETREQCAARCLAFFKAISPLPGLGEWFELSKTKKNARTRPVEATFERIYSALEAIKKDFDGVVQEDLGLHLFVWNGNHENPVGLDVCCGAWSEIVPNSVTLDLPPVGEIRAEERALMRKLVQANVEAWDPDHVIATAGELLMESPDPDPWNAPGWVKYRRDSGIVENDL